MNKLRYSTDIDAPRDRVWQVLWDDKTYRDWTSVFSEGSYAVSDWNEGSRIQFLDASGRAGMSAIIDKKRPNEFMSFRHMAEIKDGEEQPLGEGAGAFENYTLRDNGNGRTTLLVELDAPDAYRQMFEEMFPKALNRVKALSEA